MKKPNVPFCKPDGMSDAEYENKLMTATQELAEWEELNTSFEDVSEDEELVYIEDFI